MLKICTLMFVRKWFIFIFLFFQVLFQPFVFAQKSDSFIQDSIQALKFHREGVTAGRLGDYEEAINNFNQVYKIYQKLYGNKSANLVSPLNNLGIQYKNLRSLDKAIEVFKKSESLYLLAFGDDYPLLGAVYTNIGNIYRLTGDYNKALQYQEFASKIIRKDSIKYFIQFQSLKYNLIETQLKLGMNENAIRLAQSNLKTTLPRLKPRLHNLIAVGYQNESQFNLSEKHFLLAIKSWIELQGDDHMELALDYLDYSSFLLSQKQYEKAFMYSTKAQGIVLKFLGKKSSAFAEVQSNFGDYYAMRNVEAQRINDFRSQQKKNLNQAIQYYQNSIVALVDSFETKDPMVDPPLKNILSEIQLVDVLKKKALAMEKLGDAFLSEFDYKNAEAFFNAGLSSFSNATQLIHHLRIGYENEDSRLFLAQNQESVFFDAIRISYKLFKHTKNQQYLDRAFEFAERSKASNLLASIKDGKAREFGGIPDSLLRRENYLRTNVDNYTSMLFEEKHQQTPDSQRVRLYESKIFKLNKEYGLLINYFEQSYPEYYAFKYENKIVGIREIQSKLRSRDALIEFVVDEPTSNKEFGELYRFVITKSEVDFSMTKIDSTYERNIDFVHQFLTNPRYLDTKRKDFVQYSIGGYGLYETLLKPVSKMIAGKDLTVVPDDKLAYLPLDALLSQFPDTSRMDFRNLPYLVRDYAIHYSYSATLLYDFHDQAKKSSLGLIAFSPQYTINEARTDRESSQDYFFAPLPGAVQEVKNISSYVKTVGYNELLAQENTFMTRAPDFDILHLAMHTVINDSLPMFSKLVFSKSDSQTADDGFLNTYEIYNMKLKARLAVLSACQTGSGKLQKGEGVMSLARGFIYAGCPSIVMTLWQVEDQSGTGIMSNFYHFLANGKRKDVALRMAKLKHLDSADPLTAHPHYWLGYVHIGNAEALYTSKDVYFILILFIVIALVIVDWQRRKKKMAKIGPDGARSL